MRRIEAQAAQLYWSIWRDLPVSFPRADLSRVPEHWWKVYRGQIALNRISQARGKAAERDADISSIPKPALPKKLDVVHHSMPIKHPALRNDPQR